MTVLEPADPALDEPTDRDLADRVQFDRDEGAFRQLYRRHTPRLLRFVLRLLGATDQKTQEAEDVIQDIWIRAVEGLPGLAWQSTFATWLGGIALNRVREQLKRDGRWRFDELDELETRNAVGPLEQNSALPGVRLDLERAIRDLPDGYRTVLVLHDLEGMTHDEIGRRCEITVGTSRSQLFHARRAVRRRLTDQRPSDSPTFSETRS